MKSRMRATAPLRTGPSSRLVNHFLTDGPNAIGRSKATWHKCWMCRDSAHWPDQCQTFAALSIEERLKIAKENHVCLGCLKRAGREHRMENCSRVYETGKRSTMRALPSSTSAQKQRGQNRSSSCPVRSRCSSPCHVSHHLRPERNSENRKHPP